MRSVKIRRLQVGRSQKNFRTRSDNLMVYVAHGRSVRVRTYRLWTRTAGVEQIGHGSVRGVVCAKGDLLMGRIHRPVIDLHDSRIRKQQRCKIHRTSIEGVSYESYQHMHDHQKTA